MEGEGGHTTINASKVVSVGVCALLACVHQSILVCACVVCVCLYAIFAFIHTLPSLTAASPPYASHFRDLGIVNFSVRVPSFIKGSLNNETRAGDHTLTKKMHLPNVILHVCEE